MRYRCFQGEEFLRELKYNIHYCTLRRQIENTKEITFVVIKFEKKRGKSHYFSLCVARKHLCLYADLENRIGLEFSVILDYYIRLFRVN